MCLLATFKNLQQASFLHAVHMKVIRCALVHKREKVSIMLLLDNIFPVVQAFRKLETKFTKGSQEGTKRQGHQIFFKVLD